MRQVPSFAIIGNGRAAKHISHYFQLLKLPFIHWHKQSNTPLEGIIEPATHVLVLISDAAIDSFIQENPCLSGKVLVHFSGCHISSLAYGVHPLISLSHHLYDLENYKKIPFIIEENALEFNELLPGLINPHFIIPRDQKAYYHSLCVMANNFTTLLWQKFFNELETRLNIPHENAATLLESTLINISRNYHTALTGPLVRGDQAIIEKNLQALQNDPFQEVYKTFIKIFGEIQHERS